VGPETVAGGSTATIHDLEITTTVPAEVAEDLYNTAGVDGLRGVGEADVKIDGGTLDSSTIKNVRIDEQFYSGSGDFLVRAHQDSGTFIPTATAGPRPGQLTISLDNFFTVKPDFHFLNSDPAWQTQAPFSCMLDGGQNPKLGSADIT
jgi:hypothetical protein